jgi:hypothetical protein
MFLRSDQKVPTETIRPKATSRAAGVVVETTLNSAHRELTAMGSRELCHYAPAGSALSGFTVSAA